MHKHKIIFFTKYSQKGPSSRYRTFHYLTFFQKQYDIEVFPLFDDQYIDVLYSTSKRSSPIYILRRYLQRVIQVLSISNKYTVVIEYELFPYFFSLFEYVLSWKGVKFILDFDDAVFHNYDASSRKIVQSLFGKKIATIARLADHIITGSPYLTEYFLKYNTRVTEIPTSIDYSKYESSFSPSTKGDDFIIGWLGSNATAKNLLPLIPVFQTICEKYPNVIFAFCGVSAGVISKFEKFRFEIETWTLANELAFLNRIHVGIMPLEINKFNNGKCGFKLIQYMAMGKPTISTPLAANVKIDHDNGNLFAKGNSEWVTAFEKAINSYDFLKSIGERNRLLVKQEYSIQGNYHKYLAIYQIINS